MAIKISIQLIGAGKILQKMKALKGFMNSGELKLVLEEAKNRMIYLAARLAPKGLTHLLSQISGEVINFGTKNVGIKIRSAARYARYVEFDTKPHPIYPKDKKVLFWYEYSRPKARLTAKGPGGKKIDVGAVFTFRDKVDHPGTTAQPFLRPAVKQVQSRLQQAILRVLKEKMGA